MSQRPKPREGHLGQADADRDAIDANLERLALLHLEAEAAGRSRRAMTIGWVGLALASIAGWIFVYFALGWFH